jgi:integrase
MHYLTYDAVKPDGEKGLATNTVGKQIKNLKAFLNHCFRHEIAERFDLSDFKTMTEDTDAIYLTEDEINKIYSADLTSHPDLEEKRDLLVLGCQLGLRSNDLFRLKPEMVHDDMIRIKMHKSDKVVVIPLQPIAQEILKKYNGDIPNKSRRDVFNAEIKKIGRLAGIDSEIIITKRKGIEKVDNFYKKYELMSSHTCRRSFCTNQYLKGVPTVLLMKISGHSTEKAFMRYIKIDEEMAAQKMKEYW